MSRHNVQEALKALADAKNSPLPLTKSWVQPGSPTTGINAYDLQPTAKLLYPVLTPLRNMLPRVGGGVGTATNWRAVTGINTNNLRAGVSPGQRGGIIAHTTQDYTVAYRGLGLEDYVEFEAEYAGQTFEDVKALAVMGLLDSMFIQEETVLLGGNTSHALGTTPTPSLSASASGGTLATGTYSVYCYALTLEGYDASSVSGGIVGQVTRTNADGTTDTYGGGSAARSAVATVAVTGPTGSIAGTVTAVQGAVAYAWFWGIGAGNELLGAITTINSVSITDPASGTQSATTGVPNGASDNSTNALEFDGVLTYAQFGTGAYRKTMATGTAGTGTGLTANGRGGVVEIDTMLKSMWDNYRLSPNTIWVNAQEQQSITAKILTGDSVAAQRFVFNTDKGAIVGGTMGVSYLNPFGMAAGMADAGYAQGNEIPIRIHPKLPPGTIVATTSQLPYKLNGVPGVFVVKTRQDYYQLEWPLRTRRYEYGVYADEVLLCYFPPALGIITNIGTG